MHRLLMSDLERHGRKEDEEAACLFQRRCRIGDADREITVNWCDAEYGEFSGDVIERYFKGQAHDLEKSGRQVEALNCDWLLLLGEVVNGT